MISDSAVFTTAKTATLSVIRTFTSAALARLDAERVAVDALDGAADADRRRLLRRGGLNMEMATERGYDEARHPVVSFGMTLSLPDMLRSNTATPRDRRYSLTCFLFRSHRRCQAVAADTDAVGLKRAVRQLLHEGDDFCPGLQLGFVAGHEGHDRRVVGARTPSSRRPCTSPAAYGRHCRPRSPTPWRWSCWSSA